VLESFSAHAQRVVSLATSEAGLLGHARVGTEHLLLGLLSDDDGPGDVLRAAGASLAAARHKVAEVVGGGDPSRDGEPLPLTSRAQRALERAGRFSRQDRKPEVTSAHVLLGVLDVEGLACQVLRGLGVDVVHLRDAVVSPRAEVASASEDAVVAPDDAPQSIASVGPRCPACSAALDDTLAEATIAARRGDGSATDVGVVYCAACGATLGVIRPTPS
jgi:ATP-dependent Clp protease ATP-binding subunit ClpA